MDEQEEFEFRARAEAEATAPPPVAPHLPSGHGPVGERPATINEFNPVTAAAELGAQAISGAGAGILGGAGYAAAAAGKALGVTDAEPSKVMSGIQDTLTYKPTSRSSQLVERGAKTLLKPAVTKAAELGDEAATAVGKVSPVGETMMREAPAALGAAAGVLPLAAGARPLAEAASAARAPVQGAASATQEDVVGTLRAAGYKFRPSDVKAMKPGEKVPGIRRESLQDPAGLKKDITLENQATTTKLAAEDLGLKDAKQLMGKDYEKLRQPHFDKYDEVNSALYKTQPPPEFADQVNAARARAGFEPSDKPTTTQVISALRKQERKGLLSDDTVKQHAAKADGKAADSLEDSMAERLSALGEDKLHGEYQESRKALAKIHDYEAATRGGQVDAQKMRTIDKRSAGRITGNAKIISDAADFGKNVVRHSQNATGVASSVKADTMLGAVKKVGGKVLSKLPGMDVTRAGFQNKFGREATEGERGTFKDYGKRTERPRALPAQPVQAGSGSVDFTETPGVAPARSLASELELAPEPVQNPQALPEAPPTMTADVIPPVRGDVTFQGGPDPQLMQALAGELGLAPEYSGAAQLPQLAPDAPDLSMLADLVEQLGLRVDTPQPSLMTPNPEPVPFGPRVELERPAGRVGKAKKPKK